MQLHLPLSSEVEAALRRRAKAVGEDVETFVAKVVVEELADDDVESSASPTPPRTYEEFVTKLREMIQRHGIRNGHVDDSRESIYAGCGE